MRKYRIYHINLKDILTMVLKILGFSDIKNKINIYNSEKCNYKHNIIKDQIKPQKFLCCVCQLQIHTYCTTYSSRWFKQFVHHSILLLCFALSLCWECKVIFHYFCFEKELNFGSQELSSVSCIFVLKDTYTHNVYVCVCVCACVCACALF